MSRNKHRQRRITMTTTNQKELMKTKQREDALYYLAELFGKVLERVGPRGGMLESEVHELNRLRAAYTLTLSEDDFIGSDSTDVFDNPIPMVTGPLDRIVLEAIGKIARSTS
jgi:hypothetical protein